MATVFSCVGSSRISDPPWMENTGWMLAAIVPPFDATRCSGFAPCGQGPPGCFAALMSSIGPSGDAAATLVLLGGLARVGPSPFFHSSMMRLPAATPAAEVVGPSGFSVKVDDGKMELAEVVGEKDMILLLVAGGLCWSESFLEHKVTTEGVLPDPGLVDAMKHWLSECAFSKFLGDCICSSRSAAANTVAEVGGHFPAAAFPRSEGQASKSPTLSAKKEEKFRFFVKTVEGNTKVFNSKEGDAVLSLLEAVEGAVEDCYVLCNGKILSLGQSLKGYGRDSMFRICARLRGGTAHVTKARTYTPVWPALWLPALDKSKTSPNKEVQVVWKVYEERLKLVDLDCVQCLEANLAAGDSSAAWDTWANAAERALADAYCLAGGPMPLGGVLRLGRGRLALVRERLGGVQLKKARPYRSDPGEAEDLAGQCLFFLAPFLRLRRRLKICIDIASSIVVRGFTVARSLELTRQWERVLSDSPAGPFSDLEFVGSGGLGDYHAWVVALYKSVVNYIRNIVIHRRDHNIKAWRAWVLEDRSSHPYRWLRPDLVPPAPILSVRDSSGNNVFHTDPWQIDGELRKAWMPFFCRADRGAACEDAFLKEVGDRLPRLPVVDLPPLSGQILYDAVARKYASAVVVFCWEGCELLSVYDDSRCRCLGSWTIVGRRVQSGLLFVSDGRQHVCSECARPG